LLGNRKGLTDTALRIGKETAFSASEAASAMESLAANGLTVKDIMGGAADAAVNLAAAGGTKKKAADLLGITFRSIRYRLKKLGLEVPEADDPPEDPA
jgi:TP901 family phage tail tape measure protein